jgi:hypothetical protein
MGLKQKNFHLVDGKGVVVTGKDVSYGSKWATAIESYPVIMVNLSLEEFLCLAE